MPLEPYYKVYQLVSTNGGFNEKTYELLPVENHQFESEHQAAQWIDDQNNRYTKYTVLPIYEVTESRT